MATDEIPTGDQRQLRLIADELPVLIGFIDRQERYRFNNKAYYQWLGLEPAAMRGRHVREMLGADVYDRVRPYIQRALAGEHLSFQAELPHSSGHHRFVQAHYIPYNASNGEVVGIFTLVNDLTGRRRAEEALRQSEQTLRLVLDNSAVGIAVVPIAGVTDPTGEERPTFFNRTFQHYFQYDEEALLAKTIAELSHPEDLQTEITLLRQLLSGVSDHYTLEKRFYRQDGSLFWGKLGVQLLRDQHQQPQQLICVLENIDRRKRSEAALRASEERFRKLAELSPAGIYTTDRLGHGTYANATWYQMAGLPHELASHPDWVKRLHPEDRESIDREWHRAIHAGVGWSGEFRFIAADGQTNWVQGVVQPIRDEEEQITGFIGVNTDISKLKAAEFQLLSENSALEAEVARRTRTVLARQRQLEEANTALSVLLSQRDRDKDELERRLLANAKQLIEPNLRKLIASGLNERQQALAELLRKQLGELTSPLVRSLRDTDLKLTPMELQVADLIRQGYSTKKIAALLHLAPDTVSIHRRRLRQKLGLSHRKINLQTYLLSLDS